MQFFKPAFYFKSFRCVHKFVPKHEKINLHDVTSLQNFLTVNKNIIVLTGAGVSTESGLPDYRSKDVGLYERTQHRPVQYKDFVNKPEVRKRYWARNFVAWEIFSSRKANETHLTLAKWEKEGKIDCIVTQNVDRLHQKAGSVDVIELHGTSYVVKCLGCGEQFSREKLQSDFALANPQFKAISGEMRPDADVELEASLADSFNVLDCRKCHGILKPDVVFFGENVPKDLVSSVYKRIENSGALLVLGSSLEVYSGYRFVLHAYDHNKPIGIVNIGPTRADSLATFKISKCCGELLPRVISS